MRVLLVHNYYGTSAPSGENRVVASECELLRRRGHEVEEFARSSDTILSKGVLGLIQGALATPWNPMAASALSRQIDAFRPDVVHVHNTFPLISAAVFHSIGRRAARVYTLHNYRIFCAAAIPIRAGRVCTECLDGRSPWPAVKYGCYRGSRVASAPLALAIELHRRLGTWTQQVDVFVALTGFQRDRLIDAGLPASRVMVKPNFYSGKSRPIAWRNRNGYAVFAGRLSEEKGIESLIKAWVGWGDHAPELRIIGDGPQRMELQRLVTSAQHSKIRFFGQLPHIDAEAQIAGANLLLLPSICFEGFPMVIPEAFAAGTPVAASNLGPLPSIVEDQVNGALFEPGNPSSLLQEVRKIWESPTSMERLSAGARLSYESLYTEEAGYQHLVGIYGHAIESKLHRARGT